MNDKCTDWPNVETDKEAWLQWQVGTAIITLRDAERQQEAIKKIMADRKIPFEQAVDVYIKQQRSRVAPKVPGDAVRGPDGGDAKI